LPSSPASSLDRIDDAVEGSITRGEIQGAVVVIIEGGEIVYRRAHGIERREPAPAPMRPDTVFDLASLTKVVVTAPSILLLVEQGKLRLSDTVGRYLPAFAEGEKATITVEQLLLHTSGLPAANALSDYTAGPREAMRRIGALPLASRPGERFVYSDVGYIVLGALVERVSGKALDQFARERLFAPLGMRDTAYRPPALLAARAAPTEARPEGGFYQGEVHDPRARALGGVAGHAGLFSTADDLARFAEMLLNEGSLDGARVLAPKTARALRAPRPLPEGGARGLGWERRSPLAPKRGNAPGYGHTGFTGTSMWLDPTTKSALIVLTSRLYPDGKGDCKSLRREIVDIVAGHLAKPPARAAVQTGIDVLEAHHFAPLGGRRVGLIAHAASVDKRGERTIDVLRRAPGVTLVALFSPEHGLGSDREGSQGASVDKASGLPIYSLYGLHDKERRPRAEQLAGLDTLVYDLQDAGARFYTYISTLGYALEAAAEHHLKLVVLDRPNPIGGLRVEGPVLEERYRSFIGYHPLPVRHGMTVGELARLFNTERHIGADLSIVELEGWQRELDFDQTDLPWVNPSPNLRSVVEAQLYPGIALLETTNLSVGRGTNRPFEQVGAPYIDGERLAAALTHDDGERVPGAHFSQVSFTPSSGPFAGERCHGVRIHIDDRARFSPILTGLALARRLRALHDGHGTTFHAERMIDMLGHEETLAALLRGEPTSRVLSLAEPGLAAFRATRARYLLYPPAPR